MPKFQADSSLTSQVMDCQIFAIEKAIRQVFAEPVTNRLIKCLTRHKQNAYNLAKLSNPFTQSWAGIPKNKERNTKTVLQILQYICQQVGRSTSD